MSTLVVAAIKALQAALGALIAPAFVAFAFVILFRRPLSWYGATPLAYAIYLPASLAGFFFRASISSNQSQIRNCTSTSNGASRIVKDGHARSKTQSQRLEGAITASLGSGLAYATISAIMTLSGLHSSYLLAFWAAGSVVAATALLTLTFKSSLSSLSWWQVAAVVCGSFAVPLLISLPTATSITDHIVEKIGLSGSAPGPLGFVVPDIVVGLVTGASVVLGVGTLWPYFLYAHDSFFTENDLTKLNYRSVAKFMLVSSLVMAATLGICDRISGKSHPYSPRHPKRVIFMHTHVHTPNGTIQQATYDFASLDAIPVDIALPPWVLSMPETNTTSRNGDDNWVALYPLNYLVTSTSRVALPLTMNQSNDGDAAHLPTLRMIKPRPETGGDGRNGHSWKWFLNLVAGSDESKTDTLEDVENKASLPPVSPGSKRIHLELDTIHSAWAVLNITGDVRAWSLGPEVATAPIASHGASKYHIVRYASGYGTTRWRFWVDVARDECLRIELFVKHLQETPEIGRIMQAMQPWVSAAGVTMWRSSWEFE
jgi:hypothetical protein